MVKNPPAVQETWDQSLGQGGSLEKIATYSSLLSTSQVASGKESTGQCRRHKRPGLDPRMGKIPWSGKWHPTPVFLPGKFHGQRSLAGPSPWGCKTQTQLGN